jgi:serine/threonine-protein kinase
MEARVTGAESRIREERPDVPAALAEIVDKATANDPADRWSSAADMQEALDAFAENQERQVGRREVAALISECFRADRVAMRQKIEQHLSGAQPQVLMEEADSPAPAPPLSQSMIGELVAPRSRLHLAAGVIAAAGTSALVVSLLGSPSRSSLLAGPYYGGPAVHSVVLEPLRTAPRPAAAPVRKVPRPVPPTPARVVQLVQQVNDGRPAVSRPVALEPKPIVPTPRLVPATVVLEEARLPPRPRPAVRPPPVERPEPRRGPDFGSELERPAPGSQRHLDEKDPYGP